MGIDTPALVGNGTIRVCRRGKQRNILLAAFARPQVRNAINDHMYEDLIGLMQQAKDDPSVSAVVLTGTGEFFSSGADLKGNSSSPDPGGRRTLAKPQGRFMMEIISFPKILAAAVNGPAVGIAVTLLMHCDLVHCTPNATYWAPFTRLALVPELCSSVTFLHTMGLSRSNELLLLAKQISAQSALEWGICSNIVPNCDESGDPFAPNSLASKLCHEIDQRLLSLPKGPQTAEFFVSMVKGNRREYLAKICQAELLKLDQRFDTGDVEEAAQKLQIGSYGRKPQTKRHSRL